MTSREIQKYPHCVEFTVVAKFADGTGFKFMAEPIIEQNPNFATELVVEIDNGYEYAEIPSYVLTRYSMTQIPNLKFYLTNIAAASIEYKAADGG